MNVATIAEVTEAIHKVAKSKPDSYVYPQPTGPDGNTNCAYFTDDGAPSCIVGHVVQELYPDLAGKVRDWERKQWKGLGDTDVEALEEEFGLFPVEVIEGLSRAQKLQDTGETWFLAVSRYDETTPQGGSTKPDNKQGGNMSTEVTITIPVKEATQSHIEHLQATLTKRNERIARLEERLAEAEAGEPNRERLGREFRAGYEAAISQLSTEIGDAVRGLENLRSKVANAHFKHLIQVEEEA